MYIKIVSKASALFYHTTLVGHGLGPSPWSFTQPLTSAHSLLHPSFPSLTVVVKEKCGVVVRRRSKSRYLSNKLNSLCKLIMDGFKNPDSQIIKVARNLFQKNKKGKVLQSSARKSALNIFIRLKDENPNATIKSIVDRASELTGVSASTHPLFQDNMKAWLV
ncbi:hypothetical protein AVEN_230598-1 [Araneus ventricosus]|uniref:Uncharacterized protein n=1 Tax=Araneus ventricosus TaxID=182803 RepID=A0A4Y2WQJ7_ARAVE|nr:hypothetical protein AVEN_230598-1 [Araneus ventricosus]